MTTPKHTWWEKTVEYAFITRYFFNAATPLSGVQERAGDAFFQEGTKFLLVEFKRDASTLASELEKYTNYQKAKIELSGKDGHHLLIYGGEVTVTPTDVILELAALTYFGREPLMEIDMRAIGVEKKEFDAYVERLVEFKKQDARSGGGDFMASMNTVVGVSPDKKVVSATLDEYREVVLKRELLKTAEMSSVQRSGPTFGP